MRNKRYTEEFKIEAVRRVTEWIYRVAEVADRLGMTTLCLYAWKMKYGSNTAEREERATAIAQIWQTGFTYLRIIIPCRERKMLAR
jgi:transposase